MQYQLVLAIKYRRCITMRTVYIGAHYRLEAGNTMWDDGIAPRSGTLSGVLKDNPESTFGRLDRRDDKIKMVPSAILK
ncbi:hypothetical protein RRG08_033373 [Elysia crispata]|uniref:Uncharacterized protein n=1 Tax=Elysia crispata TaxID=231223 RepID=A0AAE0YYS0_9GAST|nr:hypothetical protein RRG08_033373 [Elysia crispata]